MTLPNRVHLGAALELIYEATMQLEGMNLTELNKMVGFEKPVGLLQ